MSTNPDAGAPSERTGIALAGSAYVMWGVLPFYWHALAAVPPFQLTVYRILFSAIFVLAITLIRGRWSQLMQILTTPAILRNLVLTAVLISINWTTFVYAIGTDHLVEASLGYYILPLISIALGVTLFGERMSRVRLVALGLAAIAVAVQAFAVGHLPWIALALALSFGFYGYFRKLTPVDPLDGLLVEMVVLFPVACVLFLYWSFHGEAALAAGAPLRDGLIAVSGPVTAIPLALFAAGARRIRLSTLGFLQYLMPSIALVIATFIFGEPFTMVTAITFACVWAALATVAAEGQTARFRLRGMAGR